MECALRWLLASVPSSILGLVDRQVNNITGHSTVGYRQQHQKHHGTCNLPKRPSQVCALGSRRSRRWHLEESAPPSVQMLQAMTSSINQQRRVGLNKKIDDNTSAEPLEHGISRIAPGQWTRTRKTFQVDELARISRIHAPAAGTQPGISAHSRTSDCALHCDTLLTLTGCFVHFMKHFLFSPGAGSLLPKFGVLQLAGISDSLKILSINFVFLEPYEILYDSPSKHFAFV